NLETKDRLHPTDPPEIAARREDGPSRTASASRPTSGRSRRRRLILPLVLLLVAAGIAGGVWFWWHRGDSGVNLYTTANVGRGDIEETVTALGNLQPRDYVDVGTQVSGQLKKIHV